MTSTHRSASMGPAREKTYFEQQREALLGDIGMSFEQVLANINKLNRSLESIIAVGNEFASVETLWSQFENVMGKEDDEQEGQRQEAGEDDGDGDRQQGDGEVRRRDEGRVKKEGGDGDEVMRG